MNRANIFSNLFTAGAGVWSGAQGHFIMTIDWEATLNYGINVIMAYVITVLLRFFFNRLTSRSKQNDQKGGEA